MCSPFLTVLLNCISTTEQVEASGVRTTFSVPDFGVAFGEHLRLVGSTPAMGDWTTNEGLALEWNEGNNWTASAELPAGPIEFKVLREYLSNMVDEEK